MWFRVRLAWDKPETQLGAYTIYENAVKKANEVGGYSVFDEAGTALYTAPIVVRTMSYKVKFKKTIGTHKKGTTAVVTRNRKCQWVVEKDGTTFKNKSDIDLLTQIYDPKYKFDKATAEAWVNSQGFSSKTEWLFWCNKYGQRVYIFQGSKGKWVGVKNFKCGTGNIKFGDGSDQGVGFNWKIWDKDKVFDGPQAKQYYNQHYTSKWGNSIHQGPVGKPVTHGCISLAKSSAIWVFNNIPINTKVIVF